MKKTAQDILKQLTEKIVPSIAVGATILAALYYLTHLLVSETKYFEVLLSVFASVIGAVIAYFALKIVRQKREGNVFISYNYKDKKFVERLVQSLKFKRFNIVYDDEVVKIGDDIKQTIIDNIKKADVIIYIISKPAKENDFQNYELKTALESNKKILPVIIGPDVELPRELGHLKYADFTKEYEKNLQLLTKGLVATLEEARLHLTKA